MPVFAVDHALMRDVLLPDVKLVPGRALMARVIETDGHGRGALAIAGYRIEAVLPEDVHPGQELRLQVRDVKPETVVLQIADHPPDQPAASSGNPSAPLQPTPLPSPAEVVLPGGPLVSRLGDEDDEDDRTGGRRPAPGEQTVGLSFQGTGLGVVGLRLSLSAAGLRVSVTMDPGAPLDAGLNEADVLSSALSESVDVPVAVTVVPRRRPLDVHA